jgi:HSP20 family protein
MRKDLSPSSQHAERMPTSRRSSFFSPWFDDMYEPSRWLSDFFSGAMSPEIGGNRFLAPAIDVDETSEAYVVSADLPGVKKEDISIECSGNQLTLSAERKYESGEGKRSERRERFYGSYQRSFTLPTGADADKIEASYEGGVLTVRIPKGETAKARKIEIGGAKAQARGEEATDKH